MERKELLKRCYEFCIKETINIEDQRADEVMNEFSDLILNSISQYLKIDKQTSEYYDALDAVRNELVIISSFFMSLGMDTATMLLEGVAPFDMM